VFKIVSQRMQAKLRWLQNPSQTNRETRVRIWKKKIMTLKRTLRTKISETYTEAWLWGRFLAYN